MFRRISFLIAVIALGMTACSSEEPLEGIDLPPAAVPDNSASGAWAVLFTHDFPSGAWDQGAHAYELALACDPILDEPLRTGTIAFIVSPSEVFDQQVYLRVVGLSHDLTGPQTLTSIDPGQATTAALTIIGVSENAAGEAAQSCAGAIYFDDEEPLPLLAHEPFRP